MQRHFDDAALDDIARDRALQRKLLMQRRRRAQRRQTPARRDAVQQCAANDGDVASVEKS